MGNKMVNLTPFRYPGAKPKLLPQILPMIPKDSGMFVDLFTGGGSVALAVAARDPGREIMMNDADERIACFWEIVSMGGVPLVLLCERMLAQPTMSLFNSLRATQARDNIDLAYRAIFFNRTCYNGILDSGPIGGFEQKSQYKVDCRYNAEELIRKTLACHMLLRDRTTVCGNNFDLIAPIDYDFWYCDPPYYVKGAGLYTVQCDHQALARLLEDDGTPFLLSYDDAPEIRALYAWANIRTIETRYCIRGDWRVRTEIVITPKEKE